MSWPWNSNIRWKWTDWKKKQKITAVWNKVSWEWHSWSWRAVGGNNSQAQPTNKLGLDIKKIKPHSDAVWKTFCSCDRDQVPSYLSQKSSRLWAKICLAVIQNPYPVHLRSIILPRKLNLVCWLGCGRHDNIGVHKPCIWHYHSTSLSCQWGSMLLHTTVVM